MAGYADIVAMLGPLWLAALCYWEHWELLGRQGWGFWVHQDRPC